MIVVSVLLGEHVAPLAKAVAPRIVTSVGGSRRAAHYHECLAALKDIVAMPSHTEEPDWAAMNRKAATQLLIKEYGGATANMKMVMKLHEMHGWGRGFGESASVEHATKTICVLSGTLQSLFNVNLLIDIPCGDQQWAPTLREMTPGLKYIGVDLMPSMVRACLTARWWPSANARMPRCKPIESALAMPMAKWNSSLASESDSALLLCTQHTNSHCYSQTLVLRTHCHCLASMGVEHGLFANIRLRSTLWKAHDEVAVMSRQSLQHMDYDGIFHFIDELKKGRVRYFIGTSNSPWIATANPKSLHVGGYAQLNFHVAPFRWPLGALKWFEAEYGTTEMEVWLVDRLPTGAQMRVSLAKMQQ